MILASLVIAGCCFSTSATTTARLAPWERAAVGLSAGYVRELGYFSSGARAVPWSGVSDQQARFDLIGLVRVTDKLTISALVPLAMNARSAGDVSAIGGGLGDITAGLRYDLLEFDHSGRPGLAFVSSVGVPTGATSGSHALAVDSTGRGTAVISAGLSTEISSTPWFLRGDLLASVPMPAYAKSGWSWLSPTIDAVVLGGVRAAQPLFFHVTLKLGLQLPTFSQAFGYDIVAGGGVSVRPDPQWALIANVTTSLFVSGAGMNRNAPITATLAVRYAAW